MTRTYRLSLTFSIAAGYAVLAILLFSFHEAPASVASELIPFLLVGLVGLGVVLFAPNKETAAPASASKTQFSFFGCGQKLSVAQMAGLGAAGFFFGALIHKVIRLIA
ncbi:MAG: hypothetical protein AAGJ68_11255 [Pseudomonadota bacterium]